MLSVNTPIFLILKYLSNLISDKFRDLINRGMGQYTEKQAKFRTEISNLTLDHDWFTGNIPTWLKVFEEINANKTFKNCLEIGSWQGLSAYFLLKELPNIHLTCVDTWEGADEHKNFSATTKNVLDASEIVFNQNLACFEDRITKFKGTSLSFFNSFFEPDSFDMIYVDGSHYSDDVIVDAVYCFEMLKIDGIMIFDDYLWMHYPNSIDNPIGAINSFLKLKKHQLKIISINYQLIIQKKSHSVRWINN